MLCELVSTGQTETHEQLICRECHRPASKPLGIMRFVRECQVVRLDRVPTGPKPGSTLSAMLRSIGFTADELCNCNSDASKMNAWGVEGCREHVDEIFGWLRTAADKKGILITDQQIRDLIEGVLSAEPEQPIGSPEHAKLLLRTFCGFGDHVQLTVVLRHLRHLYPNWVVEVAGQPGAATIFRGLCPWYLNGQEPSADEFTEARTLAWHEPEQTYHDSPSTKAERCLREVFGIRPIEELCRYEIRWSVDDTARARAYLESENVHQWWTNRYKAVAIHYQGNSVAGAKNLDEGIVRQVVKLLLARGFTPIILDWDRRSGLLNMPGVVNPGLDHPLWMGGDGPTLAALLDLCWMALVIDSGPGHVAAATSVPTLAVWRGHAPVNFMGLAENVCHVLSRDHAHFIRGDRETGERYFASRYHHYACAKSLRGELPELVDRALDDPVRFVREHAPIVRREFLGPDLTIERDVIDQDCYHTAELAKVFGKALPRYVVDIGAHVGAFARRIRHYCDRDATIVCVEANPENQPALRRNVEPWASVVPAACCYESAEVELLSTVYAGSDNTGGSMVATAPKDYPDRYGDTVTVPAVTLESLGLPQIDVLKLDCEGSEFSILEHADLAAVRLIVGEWHDRERFMELVDRRFADWQLRVLKDGALGLFWLWPGS